MKKKKKPLRARRTPKVTRADSPTASKAGRTSEQRADRHQRDLFAYGAMNGGFATFLNAGDAWAGYDDFAASCYAMADAMMRERERPA